jgi:hypothetical protein
MNETRVRPSEDAAAEAKKYPNGWVYEIDARYDCAGDIPPHTIVGAWKVDTHGNIIGEFITNPNYRPKEPDNEVASQ